MNIESVAAMVIRRRRIRRAARARARVAEQAAAQHLVDLILESATRVEIDAAMEALVAAQR